jgi:hypothetical protein
MYDRGPAEGVPVHTESSPAAALHSPDFYTGDPYPAYRELRATASDAPLRGALESAYRVAVISRFGGCANEIRRDIIAMAGLGMPRAPRDLRATEKSGGPTQ